MRSSCLLCPPREPIAILRRSLVLICGEDRCAAMLLNHFAYWHDTKLNNISQEIARAQDDTRHKADLSLWTYKSADELQCELLGEYGRNKILAGIQHLVALGFLVSKPDKNNKFSRRRYFQLKPEKVNAALLAAGLKLNSRQAESGTSASRNGDEWSLDLNSLPYRDLEITSETADDSGRCIWCHGRGELGAGGNRSTCGQCKGSGKAPRTGKR